MIYELIKLEPDKYQQIRDALVRILFMLGPWYLDFSLMMI